MVNPLMMHGLSMDNTWIILGFSVVYAYGSSMDSSRITQAEGTRIVLHAERCLLRLSKDGWKDTVKLRKLLFEVVGALAAPRLCMSHCGQQPMVGW